ncbi:transglutaminase-like cysteine peptidase [Bosea sp. (in: a-proteobacteria)]|uniref:transglutaminase-like cysteine peptidase n=1 Tax=Bosea sp. (in: a-proteobacteria) TaxID=1871050 RepID=UPI0026245B09|nr:transglutaminase-like cysteine peptidase [Bosea sp. (in: a-proteobacteria)]MCO5091039.1 transglutaminase-like cysteine peptidase [Bosea sp. (in: a-proteobacteria)]
MKSVAALSSVVALVLGVSVTVATAMPRMALPDFEARLPMAPRFVDDVVEMTPIAAVKFCLDYRDQCRASDEERVTLTQESWAELVAVNARINRRIAPDAGKHGYDWSLETTFGNCNDYAVQKRQALIERGFPISALSLTVAVTPRAEGHLVLTVRTDRGDFVLDNLRPSVVAWSRTGYRMIKRQSAADPAVWVTVRAEQDTVRVARLQQREKAREAGRVPARVEQARFEVPAAPVPAVVEAAAPAVEPAQDAGPLVFSLPGFGAFTGSLYQPSFDLSSELRDGAAAKVGFHDWPRRLS